MALQFALRRGEIAALEVALTEARQAGLGEGDGLLSEAEALLQECKEKESLNKQAAESLQSAIAARDVNLLEQAITTCVERRLSLQGADALLQTLQAEADQRRIAESELQAARDSQDPATIREAILQARECGLTQSAMDEAEAFACHLEASAKRCENAKVELYLALNARDSSRLEKALHEAKGVGLSGDEVEAAGESLKELIEEERAVAGAKKALDEATSRCDLAALKEAISIAKRVLDVEAPELCQAKQMIEKLEEEQRLAEEATRRHEAAEALKAAVEERNFDAIEKALHHGLDAGLAEEGAPVLAAKAALESLRGAREQQEAERTVLDTEARLQSLANRETALAGPSHKKERSAIGKEMMSLRNSEAYLSARRFLRNPEEERKRRDEQRLEIEKRAAEERDRWRRRLEDAPGELEAAIEAVDEDAVRALLIEAALGKLSAKAAEDFLSECEDRRKAAERDAGLLEFCFAGLERRAFFTASVALNELLTDKYSMQEGSDFKLKVIKACNSLLVAFRSAEYAEVVSSTAIELAKQLGPRHSASVVVSAEIKKPLGFSDEVEELLPAARADAEALQNKAARPESEKAVKSAESRASGVEPCTDEAPKKSEPAAPAAAPATAWGKGAGKSPAAQPEKDSDGFVKVTGKSGAKGRGRGSAAPDERWGRANTNPSLGSGGGLSSSSSSRTSDAHSYPDGGKKGGKGKSATGGNFGRSITTAPKDDDVLPLPRGAADLLQRDRAKAATFHEDLRTFGGRFGVSAKLEGFQSIRLIPQGFVHQDALRRSREEIKGLLEYHFPLNLFQEAEPAPEKPGLHVPVEPERRQVRLRVHAEAGAAVDLAPCPDGFLIEHVEDFPGQDFTAGEVIAEINGCALAGLGDEEMEDAFGANFKDGANLVIVKLVA
eukprot:TRINITY_DN13686_c0_g2_i1.p1 TRINITY_DN13686_c0_g2~~TRINITY_DN13686_c0_g2_i1.p1  ORF type:complete len:946 (-),score=306.26 TRINITY_DN13686_c0_g2_i1:38-2740(-)